MKSDIENEASETALAAAPAPFPLARAGGIATALVRKKAFRASRSPTVTHGMIPVGSAVSGKIIKIELPKKSRLKNPAPMLTIELDNGAEINIPCGASILNVIDPDDAGQKAWDECVGHKITLTKLGMKYSKENDVHYPVFDVIVE